VDPDEGRLLALLTPVSTPESLAGAARAAGIGLDLRRIEMLLARLEANGFYERPAKARPQGKPLSPDDTAPQLRGDLEVTPGPRPGVLNVRDVKTDTSFPMHDFEVHVGRLLDGKHK